MQRIKETFEKAWRGVIAPHKYKYNINAICPREQLIDLQIIERIDFIVPKDDGKNISAMIIKPKNKTSTEALLYLHGNGGSKVQIMGILPLIVQFNIAIISFDFIGCGNSDQGYLTYGLNESSDAELVLRAAYKFIEVTRLTVWGRSMGAVTAIAFAAKNHKIIDKVVLDSPFRFLEEVIRRVIKKQTNMPQPLISIILYFLKNQIQEKLQFPLFSEDYLNCFKRIPKSLSVLMICSDNDNIVPKEQVELFYKCFKGDKELLQIRESHEEDRGIKTYCQVLKWIKREKGKKNVKLRLYRPQEIFDCQKEQVFTMC